MQPGQRDGGLGLFSSKREILPNHWQFRAKTHAPSAKTIAAVDLARVGSGTSSNRPYVHMINNCNVCKYNVILTASAQYDKLFVY